MSFFRCSNKTDLLKYISRIGVARTSKVSQSEIKYSILFEASWPNLIFFPSAATQRPSVWQLKAVLSSGLVLGPPSLLLIVHLLPLSQSKHYLRHTGRSAFCSHALSTGKNIPFLPVPAEHRAAPAEINFLKSSK